MVKECNTVDISLRIVGTIRKRLDGTKRREQVIQSRGENEFIRNPTYKQENESIWTRGNDGSKRYLKWTVECHREKVPYPQCVRVRWKAPLQQEIATPYDDDRVPMLWLLLRVEH